MNEEKVNRRTGRINRQGENVIDRIQRENFTYLVVESNGGMPCPACCFQPCSIKPADLEPCVCFKNKYGKNIYYKKILNPIKPCKTTESTSPDASQATTAIKPNSKQPKRSSTKPASGAATPITTNAEVVSSTTATGVPPAE